MGIVKKHIVFLTPGFPQDKTDTTCITALQLFAKALQNQANIKLTVITLHYPYKNQKYNWYKTIVYPLGFNNKKKLFKKKTVLQTIEKINKQNPIDVLHSFWLGECAYFGHIFSEKHNVKHICTLMGQDAKKGNRFAKKLPIEKMHLITLSTFHQQAFFKNYNLKTPVIQWGVPRVKTPKRINKNIDIIGIGSFIKLKNIEDFILTVALIKKEIKTLKVTLVGDGILKEQLKNLIKSKNLLDTITLTGQLDYNTVQELLLQSKVLLHTSNYESFGMIFAEALRANTKIVSTKVGFAQEKEYWKTGDNPQKFATYCIEYLKHFTLKDLPFPALESTMQKYLKLYEQ